MVVEQRANLSGTSRRATRSRPFQEGVGGIEGITRHQATAGGFAFNEHEEKARGDGLRCHGPLELRESVNSE